MSRIGKHRIAPVCLAAAGMIFPLTSTAGEIGDVQWHGYLTSALMVSSDGNYSGDVSDAGGAKDTRLGLSIATQVDEELSFAAQMKAKGTADFKMELDWAFANYDISESLTLRFGKIKYPVGLYNEYIDVGYTYPWIRPPEGFYNQDAVGPNLTRISYNGFGAALSGYAGDAEIGLDAFGGVVDVPDGHVNQLVGAKFHINYEDEIRFELSATTGVMEINDNTFGRQMMMDGQRHTSYTTGLAVDLARFLMTAEVGTASMGPKMMDMISGYVMMGYRFDDLMPHITWESWDVDGGWGQKVLGVGLRKELTTNSALKFEVRQVTPDTAQKPGPTGMDSGGLGLFSDVPAEKDVTIVGVAVEMVF